MPVTSIGEFTFSYCSSLTSVTIPDSVTSIGFSAFSNCENLTSITIPDSVTSIGIVAFQFCKALTSVTIPDNVTHTGNGTFVGTPWLEEKRKENPLVIVNNILIDGQTCSGDVVIPDGVTSIGDGAFYMCSSLTSIEIPDSVTNIGEKAFSGCSSLKEITILNPDCYISNDKSTISNNGKNYYFDGTIYGYENSTAQAYTKKHDYKFALIGTAHEKETATGDMNGDNSVNIADAVLLQEYILGRQELTEEQWKNADLTGDGVVDSFDMVMLRRMIIENNK